MEPALRRGRELLSSGEGKRTGGVFEPASQHGDVDAKITASLERLGGAFRVLLQDEAQTYGLSPIQARFLVHLYHRGEELGRVGRLAGEFGLSRATVSEAVGSLEAKGLVYREALAGDGRVAVLRPTPAGKEAAAGLSGWADTIAEHVRSLPPEDKEEVIVSFILLRGVGWLGVERLSSWREAGRGALVVMFLVTSTAHFSGMKHDLAAMIPEPLPNGLWVIYLTGVFEIAGAIGLFVPRTRRVAAICLVLLMVALFPANVYAALNGIPLGGEVPTPLWLRAPMQLIFIGMLWWTSIKEHPKEDGGQRAPEPVLEHEQPSREGVPS